MMISVAVTTVFTLAFVKLLTEKKGVLYIVHTVLKTGSHN